MNSPCRAPDAARRVVGVARQPEPPDVHRHAERPRPQPGGRPHRRPRPSQATVRPARTSWTDPSVRSVNRAPTIRPFSRSRSVTSALRRRVNVGLRRAGVREQVEQVPLRHQRDVLVRARQPAEVAELDGPAVELHRGPVEAALGERGEPRSEAELVEQGQRGGVHGVAAEVAQEVGVLLQDGHRDAGAGEQQAQDHPGGAAADHEAGRALVIRHVLNIAPSGARRHPRPPRRAAWGRSPRVERLRPPAFCALRLVSLVTVPSIVNRSYR